MRKWIKRFMLGFALGMALLALFLTGGFVLLRGTPSYYRASALTPQQQAEAASRAESKLSQLQNIAADARGAEVQRVRGVRHPTTLPGATTFSFTDDELNALFNKWAETYHWKDLLSRVVKDPMVVLQHGRIIFVGKVTLKDLDTVVSIEFDPTVNADGDLDLKLSGIYGGKLPLPKDTLVSPMRQKLMAHINQVLPAMQHAAAISPEGCGNSSAAKALYTEMLVQTLNDRPSPPAVFLPTFGSHNALAPFRVTDVSIVDKTLSFTVIPMNANERITLLNQIKQPLLVQEASSQ